MARHRGPQRRMPFALLALTVGLLAARTLASPSRDRVGWVPLAQAETVASHTGRPILYAFLDRWSVASDAVEAQVFAGSTADLVNAGFVPVRVPEGWRRDGSAQAGAIDLRSRYEVDEVPILVVARPDGTLLRRSRGPGSVETGYRARRRLEEFLRLARDAAGAAPAAE